MLFGGWFSDLNLLVADYLFTEGFKSAAENFSREAQISPPIDLDSLESRMQIRRAIQRGEVDSATRMVNELDPEVSVRARTVWRCGFIVFEYNDYNVLCTTLRASAVGA